MSSLQSTGVVHAVERNQRWLVPLLQTVVFALSGVLAFLLRFEFKIPAASWQHLAMGLCVWIVAKTLVFRFMRLNRGWWRYTAVLDLLRLAVANMAGSVASSLILVLFAPPGFPRSIYVIDLLISTLLTAAGPASFRILSDLRRRDTQASEQSFAFIYGAGAAGVQLLEEIRRDPALPFVPVGFIDDDPHKRGLIIQELAVLGPGAKLDTLARRYNVTTVLIAIPSASGAGMARILGHCHEAKVSAKTIPGLYELIEGNALAKQIRNVAVEDLLGRSSVQLDEPAIRAKIGGRTILVTGAAGSIGSELCRQVARYDARTVVAVDISETGLFFLEREMRKAFPDLDFRHEIGNIQNRQRVEEIFERYRPDVVCHAAAYKHVPMMEDHVFESLTNNVFGTYTVARAAADFGVRDFVMISSDKAVRPTNIMGATKRLAELVILAMHDSETRFVAVRFGNVLGSNGSVIPLFKEQIANGGPVTVTHPDMRRFFMTIPEACQLVLQASSLGHAGEIFVLDMGEPVRIVDLARNLILLSGLRPDKDIPIVFTGIRHGEKLDEELNGYMENALPTCHEKIMIFGGSGVPAVDMMDHLRHLRNVCRTRSIGGLVLAMKALIPEYNPSAHVLSRCVVTPMPSPKRRTHQQLARKQPVTISSGNTSPARLSVTGD